MNATSGNKVKMAIKVIKYEVSISYSSKDMVKVKVLFCHRQDKN